MSDVLADLEAKIAQNQTDRVPLAAAEATALATAAAATKTLADHDLQTAVLDAGRLAMRARMLGSEAVTKAEAVGAAAVADVKSGATTAWKWVIGAVPAVGAVAGGAWAFLHFA